MSSRPRKPRTEPLPPGSEPPGGIRIQRILAAAGVDARRRAEALIRAGRVRVNGAVAKLGDRADPLRDTITLDGESIRPEKRVYWVLNKPRGVVTSTRDPEGRTTAVELVPERSARLFPVGRLDRETEGLLLLTNDGLLANALLHPSHEVPREYEVVVKGQIDARTLERLTRGVRLDDGWTAPARLGSVRRDPRAETSTFFLTLIEGRKRQIRRALLALGHPVRSLRRVRFGPLRLGELSRSAARRLHASEQKQLEAIARAVLGRARERQDTGSSGAKSRRRKAKRRARATSRPRDPSI